MDKQKFINDFELALDGLEPGTLNIESNFKELDEWDSMQALSVIAMIDADYKTQITAEELRKSQTLQNLYDLIIAKNS